MLLTHRIGQLQLVRGSYCSFGLGPFICPLSHFGPWIFILDKNLIWGLEVPDLLEQVSMLQEAPSFINPPRNQVLPLIHKMQNRQQTTHGTVQRNCSGQSSHYVEDNGHLCPGSQGLVGTLWWVFGSGNGDQKSWLPTTDSHTAWK